MLIDRQYPHLAERGSLENIQALLSAFVFFKLFSSVFSFRISNLTIASKFSKPHSLCFKIKQTKDMKHLEGKETHNNVARC